jgi:tRNA A37 threonylcarbamoyladenosine dehydratase
MGAALKLDPTRIKIAEFWKIQGDPLARALRKIYKREGQYPSRKFLCIYSDEPIEPQGEGKGSLVHITAIFGFMLAGLVIQNESRVFLKD